ncbi:MAG: hypothetical protein HY645_08900 [Acidobacteria bacterium]|nr:hypothetical protein [Acidobacteriota bacterium]
MHKNADLIDAVEYNHFYLSWLNFNYRAARAARRLQLPLVGNSDVHELSQLGWTFSKIRAGKNLMAVMASIRAGEVRVETQPLNTRFMLRLTLSIARSRFGRALRTEMGRQASVEQA